ncbi:MAG: ComEC/Rec2 family competence protein [Methylobacterium mesophilicum]|nr:ComEC/Rec2 family competence protein [Methylobacterium mesophilicum]
MRPLRTRLPTFSAEALRRDLALEDERGIVFLFGTVALGLGAVVYFLLPAEPPLWLPLVGLCAASTALWRLSLGRFAALLTGALLLMSLGMTAAKLETLRVSTRMLGAEISTKLTAQVVRIERMANGRARLTLDVVSTDRPRLRFAPTRVRASARKVPEGVAAGSAIAGIVRLMPPSGPVRPGGYDFSFESYFDGLGATGFFLRDPELVPGDGARPQTWRHRLENARTEIANRIAGAVGGTEGQIAAALVVGIRAGIPDDVNEVLRKTGLAHILSISGLHMALVAGIALASLRFALALFPAFAARHASKKFAAAGALLLSTAYFFFSGGDVAAQRSYVMLAVILAAVIFDRAALTMRNLAIAAAITIAFRPHEVMGPSFQMSFAATAALIAAYGWWTERRRVAPAQVPGDRGWLSALWRSFGVIVLGGAATSLVAGSATLLFSAYHFQRASPFGVVANLATMPFVSILVMPFCLIGMILMPFGLDQPAWSVVGFGLKAMLAIAAWCASYTPNDAIGLIPPGVLAVGTAALIVFASATTRLRRLALPLLLVGALGMTARSVPDVYVAEDGKLVGLRLADGSLSFNRDRPSAFIAQNWLNALDADKVVKPGAEGFKCAGDVCQAGEGAGSVVFALKSEAGRPWCGKAAVLVVADATWTPCEPDAAGQVVLSARDLARRGAGEIRLPREEAEAPDMRFAIGETYRPWHSQRAYSRAARGLPDYVRSGKKQGANDPQKTAR